MAQLDILCWSEEDISKGPFSRDMRTRTEFLEMKRDVLGVDVSSDLKAISDPLRVFEMDMAARRKYFTGSDEK